MFSKEELKVIDKALSIAKRQSVRQLEKRAYIYHERSGAIHYNKNRTDASNFNKLSAKVKSLIAE